MFEADSHSIEFVLNTISEKESGDEHGRTVVPVGNFGAVPVDTIQGHHVVSSSTDWRVSMSDAALEIPGIAAGVKFGSVMVVETGGGRNEESVHLEQRVCIEQDADEQRFESEQTEKDLELDLEDLRLTMEDEHRKLKVDLANKDRELEEVRLELRTLKQEYEQSSSSSSSSEWRQ